MEIRKEIIRYCLMMNSLGINQGVSGNISARQDDGAMIITPTGIPYDTLDPADLVTLTFTGHYQGPLRPSSEWRIHGAIYQNHPEIHAVVHAHPLFATALAIQHISIPAIHYMVAIGGGDDIPCADYATFGTETLARNVLSALEERTVCLMEHHGLIATGPSLSVAMDRAVQTETLARQFVIAGLLGNPRILPQEEMTRVLNKLGDYGLRSKSDSISGEGGKP